MNDTGFVNICSCVFVQPEGEDEVEMNVRDKMRARFHLACPVALLTAAASPQCSRGTWSQMLGHVCRTANRNRQRPPAVVAAIDRISAAPGRVPRWGVIARARSRLSMAADRVRASVELTMSGMFEPGSPRSTACRLAKFYAGIIRRGRC